MDSHLQARVGRKHLDVNEIRVAAHHVNDIVRGIRVHAQVIMNLQSWDILKILGNNIHEFLPADADLKPVAMVSRSVLDLQIQVAPPRPFVLGQKL
ncbi:MAG: hypothetical protein JRD93_17305 [Deltaproteobacteria bacterium]|nr:hypothetical protein [Deltaproteobacteria bacterium]